PSAALSDPEQRIHAEFSQLLLVQYVDSQSEIGERLGLRRKRFRVDHVGWFGDEIACKEDSVRRLVERPINAFRCARGSCRHCYAAQRRLLLGLLLCLVLVEAIRFETSTEGQMSGRVG